MIEYWTDVLTTGEMIFRKSELHVREYIIVDSAKQGLPGPIVGDSPMPTFDFGFGDPSSVGSGSAAAYTTDLARLKGQAYQSADVQTPLEDRRQI